MAINITSQKNNKHVHKAIKLQEKKKKKLLNEIGEIVDYSNFL